MSCCSRSIRAVRQKVLRVVLVSAVLTKKEWMHHLLPVIPERTEVLLFCFTSHMDRGVFLCLGTHTPDTVSAAGGDEVRAWGGGGAGDFDCSVAISVKVR